jgi:putative acyl-CoA dehydrogenase
MAGIGVERGWTKHEANQAPAFRDVNLFESDPCLRAIVSYRHVDTQAEQLAEFGGDWGSAESFDLGRLANQFSPALRTVDPTGERMDRIEFHPAYHALMQKSMAAGLHASTWDGTSSHLTRAVRLFMAYQIESGHICPVTMTHACVAALQSEPSVLAPWRAKIMARIYDPQFKPWWEKQSVTIGMGMTERQGGTDVRTNESVAELANDHYEISGEKWFMSAPMCDAFLTLAQSRKGLTCFLMPRFMPDGKTNRIFFQRLKDKLGNRSNASSEVHFQHAYAQRLGPEGRGIRTILEMVQLTRLDCAIASAGLIRMGLAQAVHHARHRIVFQRRLIDQPVMRSLLADLTLESVAATASVLRLAHAFDAAPTDPLEAAYARLMTPAVKYLVCKLAPQFIAETMECLGGNGYVEEGPLARLYREAPVNAIWEGSGNVMALDVLRAAARAPEASSAVIEQLKRKVAQLDSHLTNGLIGEVQIDNVEQRARRTTERLARVGALAALVDIAPDFARTYATSRLSGQVHTIWGASELGKLEDRLLDFALP